MAAAKAHRSPPFLPSAVIGPKTFTSLQLFMTGWAPVADEASQRSVGDCTIVRRSEVLDEGAQSHLQGPSAAAQCEPKLAIMANDREALQVGSDELLSLEPVADPHHGDVQSRSRMRILDSVHVLIVDKEERCRKTIRRLLNGSEPPIRVTEVPDFGTALDALDAHAFDCILLDHLVEEGNGLEPVDRLNQLYGLNAPAVVLLSKSDSQRLGVDAVKHGAAEVISKADLEMVDLAALVVRAVSEQRHHLRAQTARLAAFSRLIANTAHGINNPAAIARLSLSAVIDVIEGLENAEGGKIGAAPRLLKLIGAADEALTRISNVVRELEAEVGTSLGHVQSFGLSDVVKSALTRSRSRGLSNVECGALESKALLRGDLPQLARLVCDLLENAVEAGPPGKPVSLSTWDDGRWTHLVVDDRGPGIPREDMERIFEPLYTTRAERGALGLGLPRAVGIARRHGGTLGVEPAPNGEGARFHLRLRAAGEPVRRLAQPSQDDATYPARVLVVEDEPLLRQYYFRILVGQFDVHLAEDTAEADEILSRFKFDAILCDVTMPKENGVSFARRLLRRDAAQAHRLVFISGGVVDEDAAHFVQTWENGCLRKPSRAEDVRNYLLEFVTGRPRPDSELP